MSLCWAPNQWVWALWGLVWRQMHRAGEGHGEGEASAPSSLLLWGLCPVVSPRG